MSFKAILKQKIRAMPREERAAFLRGAVLTARYITQVATSNPFLKDEQWDKLSLRDIKEALKYLQGEANGES